MTVNILINYKYDESKENWSNWVRAGGNGLLSLGHQVMLSSRDITKLSEWIEKGKENAFVGSFKEAAEFGDIIVLAVSGRVATEAIESAGPQYFNGKTVIDPTNPISENPPGPRGFKLFYRTG